MSLAKPKQTQDTSDDDGTKELLIRQVRADLDNWFEDPGWTVSEVKNAVTYYMTNGELISQFWEKMEKPELRVKMDEHGRIVKENGRPVLLDIPEYINTKHFRGMFEMWIREDLRLQLMEMDTITRLGGMRAYPFGSMKAESWFDRTPWYYLKNFDPWGFGVIYGNPNSGKTDFAVTLIDDILALESYRTRLPPSFTPYRVVTNIKIKEPPSELTYTRKFSQMLLACLKNLLNHGCLTICVLDELSQYFARKKAMSKKYQDMERMIFLFRKPGGNLISIVQRPADIPSVVESFSETMFYKKSQTKLMIKHGAERTVINGIPPTRLHYDHRDPASFLVDVDMDDFHGFIMEAEESDESVLPKMVEYLTSSKSFQLSSFQINNYIKVSRLKRRPRPTYDLIGRELGMSASAISQRCDKMGILDKQLDAMGII